MKTGVCEQITDAILILSLDQGLSQVEKLFQNVPGPFQK